MILLRESLHNLLTTIICMAFEIIIYLAAVKCSEILTLKAINYRIYFLRTSSCVLLPRSATYDG